MDSNLPDIFSLLNQSEEPEFLKKRKDSGDLFIVKETEEEYEKRVRITQEQNEEQLKKAIIVSQPQITKTMSNAAKAIDKNYDQYLKLKELENLAVQATLNEMDDEDEEDDDEEEDEDQDEEEEQKVKTKNYKKIKKSELTKQQKQEYFKKLNKAVKKEEKQQKEQGKTQKKKSIKDKEKLKRQQGKSSIQGWKSDEAFRLRQEYD